METPLDRAVADIRADQRAMRDEIVARQAANHWPGNCPECNRPLNDSAIRHGWVTVQVGFDQARVHTICRSKFNARSLTEQKALNRDRDC